MLRSKKCNLYGKNEMELAKLNECNILFLKNINFMHSLATRSKFEKALLIQAVILL